MIGQKCLDCLISKIITCTDFDRSKMLGLFHFQNHDLYRFWFSYLLWTENLIESGLLPSLSMSQRGRPERFFLNASSSYHASFIPKVHTYLVESVQDFLIKLDIKPLMHLLEISTFSLDNVIIRLTKIMNNLVKDLKILSFKVTFQCLKLVETFRKKNSVKNIWLGDQLTLMNSFENFDF